MNAYIEDGEILRVAACSKPRDLSPSTTFIYLVKFLSQNAFISYKSRLIFSTTAHSLGDSMATLSAEVNYGSN